MEESVDVLMAKLKAKGHDFTNGTPSSGERPSGGIAGQMEEISQMQQEQERIKAEVSEKDELLRAEQE